MTPLPKKYCLNINPAGDAEIYPELLKQTLSWKNAKNGYNVFAVHFGADEEKNNLEWFEAETRQLEDSQIRQEYLLDFTSRAGQRAFPYLEYAPHKWLIDTSTNPLTIPKNWTIIAGLDFGGRNPTSIHFYAIDHRGRFHAFWEFYKPSSPSEIARVLKQHPLWDRVLKVVVDPSIYNKNQHSSDPAAGSKIKSIADQIEELGIYNMEPGINNRKAGFQRVRHMLRYSDFNKNLDPYLKITTDCPNLWRELNGLTHREQTSAQLLGENLEEDVVKKDDHAYDELKYALMSWKVPSEGAYDSPIEENSLKEIEEEIDEKYRNANRSEIW